MPENHELTVPEGETPSSITEVVSALRSKGLEPTHDKKSWGDWINLTGHQTVISIESQRGLARSATVELDEGDADDLLPTILAAFAKLGWMGIDEDGPYQL